MVATQDAPNEHTTQDMTKVAWMLEAVGAGCDEREMYEIVLQMKRLGENPSLKLSNVRFFGKFFGLHQDYYVFEASPKTQPQHAPETSQGMICLFRKSAGSIECCVVGWDMRLGHMAPATRQTVLSMPVFGSSLLKSSMDTEFSNRTR